jgi:hypothetical protein
MLTSENLESIIPNFNGTTILDGVKVSTDSKYFSYWDDSISWQSETQRELRNAEEELILDRTFRQGDDVRIRDYATLKSIQADPTSQWSAYFPSTKDFEGTQIPNSENKLRFSVSGLTGTIVTVKPGPSLDGVSSASIFTIQFHSSMVYSWPQVEFTSECLIHTTKHAKKPELPLKLLCTLT